MGSSLPNLLAVLRDYIKLTHPSAVVQWMILTIVFSCVFVKGCPDLLILLRIVAAIVFSQISIGCMNDFCDREEDSILKPWRPIPSGRISTRTAVLISGLAFLLAVSIGATFGILGVAGILVGAGSGYAHNIKLKSTVISWLPFLVGFLVHPTWIWVVTDHDLTIEFAEKLVYLLPLIFGIHIANQLPDIEDEKYGVAGLVHRLQPKKAIWLASTSLTCAPLVMMIPIAPDVFVYPRHLIFPGLVIYFGLLIRAFVHYSKGFRRSNAKRASSAIRY
ncbi:MAG: UbiA family prenyltransferase, partial [candidate division Zixibacteria bacterium]